MNEHSEHRQRVKKRFLEHGIDIFDEHQIVELLLFYGIPRQDTNVIAHRLIDRFGSLRQVMDAPYEALLEVEGIGPNAASLIKLSSSLARRYLVSEAAEAASFDTVDKIGKYLVRLFLGKTKEETYLLSFNGKMELLSCDKLAEGEVNAVGFSMRPFIESAMRAKASNVVVAHNHPSGVARPSEEDINFTVQLESYCEQIGVPLLEHFIVAENRYCTVIRGSRSRSPRGSSELRAY